MLKLSEKPVKDLLDSMSNDQMHLTRFILEALDGKMVNTRGGDLSRTPLICSTLLPEPHVRQRFIRLLLDRGAEVNCRDRAGRTALSYSCEKGHLQEVQTLVQHGADPELTDLWGNTALIYAAVSGHAQVLEFLARAFKRLGLQINRANRVGNSALDVARYLGHRDCELALSGGYRKEGASSFPCGLWEQKQREITRGGIISGANNLLLGRSRSLASKHHLESMDSIEEEEGGRNNHTSGSSGPGFSSVLNPRPRSWSLQYGTAHKGMGQHLPALSSASIQISTTLYSPRPGKQPEPVIAPLPGPLGILLTPLSASPQSVNEGAKNHLPGCSKDTGFWRFNESYYQKRSSLPSTLLSPVPPDRERFACHSKDSASSHSPTASSNPFTVLGNKLLRRFTFPEFKKPQVTEGDSIQSTSPPMDPKCKGMAKSETFPVVKKHPQVVSKPSIDSISSVKCEFDFQQKSNS